jgi:protein-disulfide isomerase
MQKFLSGRTRPLLGLLALCGIAIFLVARFQNKTGHSDGESAGAATRIVADQIALEAHRRPRVANIRGLHTQLSDRVIGARTALVSIVEYADFECPPCGRFARDVAPLIQRDYIDSGVVRFSFRHYPNVKTHPHALDAAIAAQCAVPTGRFWSIHLELFAHQDALASYLQNRPTQSKTCTGAERAVQSDLNQALLDGVVSTPTFLIGRPEGVDRINVVRKIYGAQSYELFTAAIDDVMTEAESN